MPFKYSLETIPGTEKYEVKMLSENEQIPYRKFLYDTIANTVILLTNRFCKISHSGSIIDTTLVESMGLYNNGIVDKNGGYISEWIINNDTGFVKPEYIPSPQGESAFKAFDEDYHKAKYYMRPPGGYPIFKINGKWITYGLPFNTELNKYFATEECKKKYPLKPSNRFVSMQEIGPDFGVAPQKRDTSLLKSLGYAAVDKETEDWGITRHRYSAGFYNMELYLPGGDTLRFRHFGALGINLELFRVPKEYGGRDDVFFIAQDPNPLYPDLSTGGVYVIRPRYLPEDKPRRSGRLSALLQATGKNDHR
ncbi:hypothetical protein SAMN04487894_1378 [Niabella drilacis]|uniref:Uncharacterized protein n=2 Tax=Niabella drilacis (strain DSM 25811 / CCM 8410 / CCUG 62505 / LMG 26954 / E90) TaxID=1285928 RepID=A0A1G7C2D2_NIADE|nr:hypothetical protein SAMN04487894_1378 [Niabella drilacis]